VRQRGLFVLLLFSAACATTSVRRATPVPQPTATPPAVAKKPTATPPVRPTPVPTVPPPARMPIHDVDPPLIRVLLERTSESVELPQPGRAYFLQAEDGTRWLWGPLRIRPSSLSVPRWWQVGAWADFENAQSAAESLRRQLGIQAEVHLELAEAGLTRVRVQWVGSEPSNPQAQLAELGFEGAFPVTPAARLRIEGADGGLFETSGEVAILPAGEWPVAVGSRRYRGRLRARAAGGEVLIINELNLESYLRGVVPLEMGPSQFPELAALKAQAVAARTYAVAHLGDHEDEGWDLCDTPACQVYGGSDGEHPLSDRAVEETASMTAVFGGEPIDAMYTSTCGGHTETAAELFPDRAQPYLQGVVCAWDRPLPLVGTDPSGGWRDATSFAASVARSVLGLAPEASPEEILLAVQGRTGVVGAAPTSDDVESFAASLLNLTGLEVPPGMQPGGDGLDRLLFLSDLYRVPLDPPTSRLEGDWPAAAALASLELYGAVVRDRGDAVPRSQGVGIFPRRAEHGEDLHQPLPLWERWQNGFRPLAATEVLPGTELERVRASDDVVALVVVRSGGGGEADRRSAWRDWVREKSWKELEVKLGVPGLEKLEVTRRSPSGRVVGLAAVGTSGESRTWSGFEVRRALGLPETLFVMDLRSGVDGETIVRFLGRGWGHGIGLCQNGAYGLARSGQTFDQILRHYYTGIEIVSWVPGASVSQSAER